MRKLKFLMPLLFVLLLVFCSISYADSTDKATLGGLDSSDKYSWRVDSSDNLIPGTTSQNDVGGTSNRVDTVYADYIDSTYDMTFRTSLIANGRANGGVSVMASDLLAVPTAYALVYKYIGADAEALTLANGIAGQILTIVIEDSVGGTATLTPTTTTGFTSLAFDAKGDTAILLYIDDTYGWILVGSTSVTVTAG